MRSTLRRVTFSIAVAITLALGMGSPPSAQAISSRTTCFANWGFCVLIAGQEPDRIRSIAKSLDCGVDLVACIRSSIFG